MERDLGERLDGEHILEESPGDLGLLLWRTARDVALWAMTPEETRAGLFADGTADARVALVTATELPDRISAPMDTLHGLLGEPDRADAEIVMLCCGEIAAWARRADLPHTAVAFAQAGAAAAPESGDETRSRRASGGLAPPRARRSDFLDSATFGCWPWRGAQVDSPGVRPDSTQRAQAQPGGGSASQRGVDYGHRAPRNWRGATVSVGVNAGVTKAVQAARSRGFGVQVARAVAEKPFSRLHLAS
ncbi:MAG TPA: hypothetical protein VF142_02850 [Longimicrobium sp.]